VPSSVVYDYGLIIYKNSEHEFRENSIFHKAPILFDKVAILHKIKT